jgi:hypothetical protein
LQEVSLFFLCFNRLRSIYHSKWVVHDQDPDHILGQGHEVGEEGVAAVTVEVEVAVLHQIHTGNVSQYWFVYGYEARLFYHKNNSLCKTMQKLVTGKKYCKHPIIYFLYTNCVIHLTILSHYWPKGYQTSLKFAKHIVGNRSFFSIPLFTLLDKVLLTTGFMLLILG